MIEGSPFQLRAKANNLSQNEQALHDQLMATKVCYWPESLQRLCDLKIKDVGLCGDVIAATVADWIRH